MNGMPTAPAHAKPVARRDHLWVLAVIAVCALLEVWASWVTIGSLSGFPKIGGKHGMPTDWILAVTTEAYWGYALYAWLAGAPGPKSRRFAMWSAVAVFALSLVGQAASHLVKPGTTPPPALIVFVTALPVLVLALIAVLIHMRQLDREDAEKSVRQDEEASEIASLRADLDAARGELEPIREALAEAKHEAEDAKSRSETLARKLAAKDAKRTRTSPTNSRSRKDAKPDREPDPETDPVTDFPADFDARAEALSILAAEPNISGAKLGERVGKTGRWGQLLKAELATAPAGPDERRDGGPTA